MTLSFTEDAGQFHRALVWSNNTNVCLMDIRVLTTVDHLNIIQCVVSGGFQIKHFDIGTNSFFYNNTFCKAVSDNLHSFL